MKKIGFGIMGPGGIARKFAEAMKVTEGAYLVAVASKSIDKAEGFAEKHGIPAFYGDYDEMCKNPDVDVVYISTTTNFHYENILTCLENNKHVLCEKPMVMTRAQAEDVFEKAKQKGVFIMEAMWSRCLPATIKVKELIASEAIGDVKHISSTFNYLLPYKPKWRIFNKDLGGGVLYDLGVYNISLSLLFAGEKPVNSAGYASICSEGTDISDTVIMKFPSGATAAFVCSNETGSPNDMNIYGTKGSIRLNNRFNDCRKVELFNADGRAAIYDFEYDNGFVYQIAEAVKCINAGKQQSDFVTWQDTLDCIDIMEKLLTDGGI